MAGRKSDFTLPTLDDLFSTQELRDDAKLSKIRDIPLELIDDFPDHPFKVRDDEDMIQLVESVKERGVITLATVRQKEDGRYELISGHRRKRACELAGFEALRCEVVDLDKTPTAKSANPDLIIQCIEEKKRHNSVGVKIVQYHKSPLLIETHDRATEAMAKTRKEFHQKNK